MALILPSTAFFFASLLPLRLCVKSAFVNVNVPVSTLSSEEVQKMKRLFQLIVVSFAIVALSNQAFAQQQDGDSQRNPLVRLLQTKGIITEQEAAMISEALRLPRPSVD